MKSMRADVDCADKERDTGHELSGPPAATLTCTWECLSILRFGRGKNVQCCETGEEINRLVISVTLSRAEIFFI
jgi:hypothetical protein